MIDFNGTQAIDLANGGTLSCLNGVAAGTICGWFSLDVTDNGNLASWSINNGGTPTNTVRMELDKTGGGLQVTRGRAGDGAGILAVTDPGAPVTLTTLHQMGAVVNVGSDTGQVYRDGALVISGAMAFAPATFDATSSAAAAIMANPNASTNAAVNGASDGRADDVRIYQRALTLAEFETINACRGHDGIWFAIHHRWRLNEQAPGVTATGAFTVKDIANARIDGTPRGAGAVFPVYAETQLSHRRRFM